MRIIAGEFKGARLTAPKDTRVRPTTDRVRESLFSILGDLRDVIVVDGFAGSGALGLEALSRGARRCYFIDSSKASVALVQENVRRLKLTTKQARIKSKSFRAGIASLGEAPDLIFVDPPYGTELAQDALEVLAASARVTAGVLVVVEQATGDPAPVQPAFDLEDERVYGNTVLRFFRRREAEDDAGADRA